MATESPLRMPSHESATFVPSTPNMAVEDLGFLRNDDNSKISLHLSQGVLSTHKEELEDDHSPKEPLESLANKTNGFWSGDDAAPLAGQSKRLVDIIQEDFPRTPSPVYNQSRSLSPGTTDEAAEQDVFSGSLHDSTASTSNGVPSILGTTQPKPPLSKGFLNRVDIGVIESRMKDLNISSPQNSKEQKYHEQWHHSYQSHAQQHQVHQQPSNAFQVQNAKSQRGSQGVNSANIGMDQLLHGPSTFSAEVQSVLQSLGIAPPLYGTTGYMTSPNPFYPNLQAPGLCAPQYGIGGYALNSTVIPPYVAGYPPHGTVSMVFDGSASPNFNAGMSGSSSEGSLAHGADAQHYNKFYGQLGYVVQPSFIDPLYMQYYQQPYGLTYDMSGQFDPLASGGGAIGRQNNAPASKKGSEVAAGLEDQKLLHHQRGGVSDLNRGRGRVMNLPYFGNSPNIGILQYPSSPLVSPVLPGSPVGGTGFSGGRNEMRFPPGSGRYASVFSGWQGQRGPESFNDPKIHNFLEELKSGKVRKFELSDIVGHIVEFSADQHGSRFIQQKLENCSAEEKALVFKEVLPHASKLMTDVFGNYLIQKVFEYGSMEQRKELANQLTGQILHLSLQMYGCRVIQKALDVIELDQKAQLVLELDGHVMKCVRDQNGNHVIQKCIESVPAEKIGFIFSAFCGEVATLSMHPYGCRVIQRVLEHCAYELQCDFIVDEILESVLILAQDQYGNYVTQHVLERGKPRERYQIISKLSGHIVLLSQHKFGSNVVEKCLEYGGVTEREIIIQEILGQNEGNDDLLTMMKDQYANYVVQKILDTCTDIQRAMLLNRIRTHVHALKKYTYGKHIVARFEQQYGEGRRGYANTMSPFVLHWKACMSIGKAIFQKRREESLHGDAENPCIGSPQINKGFRDEDHVAYSKSYLWEMIESNLLCCVRVVCTINRPRKEGKINLEEDVAGDSQSLSMFEEDSVEEGSDNESDLQEHRTAGIVDADGDSDSENILEASNTDQEQELDVKSQTVAKAPASRSSFHSHLEYKLPETEVEDLLKKKWKYQWDVPAFGMPNCKWVGTGESVFWRTSGSNDFHSSPQRFFFSSLTRWILVTKNDSKVGKRWRMLRMNCLVVMNFLESWFTRPKVLILLPFKSIANRAVNSLIKLTPGAYKVNVEHMSRFSNEFGNHDDEDNVNTNELTGSVKNSNSQKSSKPPDHQALFDGNVDDKFMIGIKFTRKSIKLFSDFYSSDLIVASPLALLKKIEEAKRDKEKDVDYLSSIEVLIIDHADVIAMQNWAFLTSVLEQLNCIPSKQHGTDIMRIRKWYLDGHARFYRQTIVLGCYANPDINASFNRQCVNYQGKVKLICQYKGVLPKVSDQVRQIYQRFDADSVAEADNARLDYFVQKVFPKIKDSDEGGVMLFISSYYEYVRLRNFLKSQNASLCLLGDYAEPRDVTRMRNWFRNGEKKIMLYTERFHFYRRYKIGGVRNLIIYSLPERKEFFPEVVNMLEGADDMTCTVLFSQYDQLQLERIVGTASARRMITSEKGVFVFC
ncbi:hypothetical protein D5086_005977 [Populus alba]|uniref:Uncharacterized protein n=1 Tax=Populus alba TaxID=43335 RepID=A0ACC4CKI1_POPAL